MLPAVRDSILNVRGKRHPRVVFRVNYTRLFRADAFL